MSVEYITKYPHLCATCQSAIDACAEIIGDGNASDEYTSDEEGPSMLAYDQALFCSSNGRDCAEAERRKAISEAIQNL
jgi:hypothetical protein